MSNKERAELDKLPQQIEELEAKQLLLSEQLANPELYKGEAQAVIVLKSELTAIEDLIARAMKRWEELLVKDH